MLGRAGFDSQGRVADTDNVPVSDRRPIPTNSPLPRRIAIAIVMTAVLGGSIYLFRQRHVYRVSVGPGEVAYVDLDVPMQRFGRSKSFAKERGLPVVCTVSEPGDDDRGVGVSVVETGHTIHRLRARLRVQASRSASPGSRRRSIKFTIDGHGGWPTAAIVVTVPKTDTS